MSDTKERDQRISEAILNAVNAEIGNSEVLEVVFVIASDNRDTGKSDLTYGSCLTSNRHARKVMLSRALERA